MFYLIGSAAVILIISIILFAQSSKKAQLTVEQAIEKYREQIEQSVRERKRILDEVEANLREVQVSYERVEQMRLVEQDRAKEAHAATERLLVAEHERARAELERVKEVEELKLKQEMETKRHDMQLLFDKENADLLKKFEATKEVFDEEILAARIELDEFQAKCAAVNEAIRREEELQNELDSHRIILSDSAKEDIHYLISIEPNIHNKDLLHKLIWSEYLQLPFNNMLKKMFGSNIPKNVIYCIENIESHKKYIGKTSAEVSKRWTEHIKSSLNIGGIKRQNIHEVLFNHWDEYTFSIIEIVTNAKLNEREKFYIGFFETDKYGYNQKGGG